MLDELRLGRVAGVAEIADCRLQLNYSHMSQILAQVSFTILLHLFFWRVWVHSSPYFTHLLQRCQCHERIGNTVTTISDER